MRRGPELLALLGVAAWLAVFWRGPLINDVGWQLWIGRQLNSGARLYVDILEVNPPLWFWLGALVERVTTTTGLGGLPALLLLFAACATVSIYLCSRLVGEARERALLYASLLANLVLTSPYALGQREQFAWIVVLPYVALIARRAEGRPVSWGVGLAVGLCAASGFALKHYFVAVPVALEAWLWWRTKHVRLRPELVALAGAAAAYGVAMALLAPDYFGTMVPLLSLAYGGYDESLATQLQQPALFAALFAVAAVAMRWRQVPLLAQAAAVAAALFAAAYLLQGKAFHYHAIPALGAGLLALLVGFAAPGIRGAKATSVAAAGLALAAAAVTPLAAGPARFDQPARAVTAALPAGSAIVVISASGVAAWPTVYEHALRWPSRHMTLWMLPRVWRAEQAGAVTPELARLAAQVRAEVARDITCARPSLVLVDSRYDSLAGGDLLAFMSRDPALAQAMQSYVRQPDVGYLRVFRRRQGASPSVPPGCSRVSSPSDIA